MMSSKLHAATVSLLVALGAAPQASARGARLRDVYSATLSLGSRSGARCEAAADGVAARLVLSRVPRERAEALGRAARVGPYLVRFEAQIGGRVIGTIDAEQGVVRCRVRRRRHALRLYVGLAPREDRLRALEQEVRRLPDVAIDSPARRALAPVEKLIKRRRYELARAKLRALRSDRQLRSLVELRLADISALAGRFPSAHLAYSTLARRLHSQPLGLVATLRAAEIAYAVEGRLPNGRAVRLFSRKNRYANVKLRSRVGELLLVGGARERALSLSLEQAREDRALALRALRAATRRRMWRDDAYGAALLYLRARKVLDKHLSSDVRRRGARIFLRLGLPSEAARELQNALRRPSDTREQEQLIGDLLRAYRDADDSERALQTADYYLSRFGYGAPRRDLALRVRVTQRLRSGNVGGALADLSRLGHHRAPRLARIARLSLGDTSAARGRSWTVFRQLADQSREPKTPARRATSRHPAALARSAGDSL